MSHSENNHHDHDDAAYHGTYKSYIIGFVLSVILTSIPFALVMGDVISNPMLNVFTLVAFAVVQIIVHMIYFLHMSPKAEGGWNMMAFGFTIVLVIIAVSGSVWVMYHMNENMMPTHEMETAF